MLKVIATVVHEMIAQARDEYPKEACGLLAGKGGVATRVLPMRNADASPISYTMDPKEQLQVMKRMRRDGLEMLAIYHSHTATPAYPSPTDVRLATYPEVSYVLISLTDQAQPDVKSFRIANGQITPEALDIVEQTARAHG